MKNKFVYSCSIKICAFWFDEHFSQRTLGKHFLLPGLLWKCFPCKKLSRCLKKWQSDDERSGECGRWGKTSQPNSFNFLSAGCTICGRALLWKRTGPFLLTSASCRPCSFQRISLICWACFSDVMVSLGFRTLYKQTGRRPPNKWPWSFWVQVWLWEVLQSFFSVQTLS